MLATLVFPALLAASARAHTIFQQVYVNGVSQGHLTGIRYPTYDGPITDVTSTDLICNGGPNPLTTPYPTTVISIPAGAQVTAEWHHTLDSAGTGDPADPIDPSHLGPIMTYLAAVPSATQTTVTGLQWFKIYESGLSSNGTWATTTMIANAGKVTFTIPSCLKAGQYFMRHEIIALHAASTYPGAQFYMECAQIQITGGGSASPATVSFPGAYAGTDPGITIDIYYPVVTNYTIPGPRPFTCSGSTSAPATSSVPPATSSVPPATSTKPPATSTAPPATTTSAPSSATVPKYGQCGGQGYTGPTVCAAGSTCTVSNQYYSQCL